MSDEPPDYDKIVDDHQVLVFRNIAGEPIAVPDEVVSAGERAYRSYKMRIEGHTWLHIANDQNYPSASAAQYDVNTYMAEAKALVTEKSQMDMLTLEIFRLDAIQQSMWVGAMAGSVAHAKMVVDIIMKRSQLLGIDSGAVGQNTNATTLVVPMESAGFITAMKKAAEAASNPVSEPVPSDHHHEEEP